MLPGTISKCSEELVTAAATIDVRTDIVRLSGTTSIATINPHYGGGFSGHVLVVPITGDTATLTTGNIAVAVTMPQSRATVLVYCKSTNTWYPGAIS